MSETSTLARHKAKWDALAREDDRNEPGRRFLPPKPDSMLFRNQESANKVSGFFLEKKS
jgi:hypothetical protein